MKADLKRKLYPIYNSSKLLSNVSSSITTNNPTNNPTIKPNVIRPIPNKITHNIFNTIQSYNPYRNYKNEKNSLLTKSLTEKIKSNNISPTTNPINTNLQVIKTGKAGKGTYGIVYIAETTDNHKTVVVKRNIIDTNITFFGSLKELDILEKVKYHPNIVELLSTSFSNPFINVDNKSRKMSPIKDDTLKEDKMYFIFEKGNYDGHQMIYDEKLYNQQLMKKGMVDTLLGVEYLHGLGIVHRDLKPANLLWFINDKQTQRSVDDFKVKICDFGLSKIITQQEVQTPKMVTSWYRAPEICSNYPHYSSKIDMWSIGCIFFEMIAKKPYLKGIADKDNYLFNRMLELSDDVIDSALINKLLKYKSIPIVINVNNKSNKLITSLNLSDSEIQKFPKLGDYIDLLTKLLHLDPDVRISATEALNHKYFDEYSQYIHQVRTQYVPQINIPKYELNLIKPKLISERNYIFQIVYNIFNDRNSIPWYRHRIIFLAIDMFDRYLIFKSAIPGNDATFSKYEVELKFLTCLYISYKYFITLDIMYDLTTFIPYVISKESRSSNIITMDGIFSVVENFELFLITEVVKCQVYRNTLFELSDLYGDKLNEYHIRSLLLYYGLLHEDTNKTGNLNYDHYYENFRQQNQLFDNNNIRIINHRSSKLVRKSTNNNKFNLKILDRVDYYQTTNNTNTTNKSRIPNKPLVTNQNILFGNAKSYQLLRNNSIK